MVIFFGISYTKLVVEPHIKPFNLDSIYYIGFTQAWFAALLVYRKPNKGLADKLLIVWLLVIGLEMLYSLLNLTYCSWLPDLIIIPLCYGPFLMIYTRLLVSKKPRFSVKFYLHLVPALLFILVSFLWGSPIHINAVNFMQKGAVTFLALTNYSFFLASMLYYWWVVLRRINSHNKTLTDHFSYRSDSIKLGWLKIVIWWILGAFIGSAITFFIFFLFNIFPFNPIELFHLGLLFFTFSISYYGIHQPVLYQQRTKKQMHLETVADDRKGLGDTSFGENLRRTMHTKKMYLNSELTIQDFADELGVPPSQISSYLNKELGLNFFSFVNGFRIQEAKERLASATHSTDTLLGIAFDSGFNSKSSFNSLFKKETGMTPSEYRKVYGSK